MRFQAESALPRRPGEVTAAEKVSARRKAVQRREQCRAALQEQQKLQAKASAQRSIYPDWWYELAVRVRDGFLLASLLISFFFFSFGFAPFLLF